MDSSEPSMLKDETITGNDITAENATNHMYLKKTLSVAGMDTTVSMIEIVFFLFCFLHTVIRNLSCLLMSILKRTAFI